MPLARGLSGFAVANDSLIVAAGCVTAQFNTYSIGGFVCTQALNDTWIAPLTNLSDWINLEHQVSLPVGHEQQYFYGIY
jgi:hypothetical protein